ISSVNAAIMASLRRKRNDAMITVISLPCSVGGVILVDQFNRNFYVFFYRRRIFKHLVCSLDADRSYVDRVLCGRCQELAFQDRLLAVFGTVYANYLYFVEEFGGLDCSSTADR